MKKCLFSTILVLLFCTVFMLLKNGDKYSISLDETRSNSILSSIDESTTEISIKEIAVATEITENKSETNLVVQEEEQIIEKNISDDDFVNLKEYIPGIVIDLKYSTTDNFTGKIIYEFSDAYLRYGTVKKLQKVQHEVNKKGYSLKIWDAYRPIESQFKLWDICPDSTYVANPNKGYSSHSRGNTVDITLVDSTGEEIIMPTGFDDFSKKADRDYNDCSEIAAANAEYLEHVMYQNGFKGYSSEWWHYSDTDVYDVEKVFIER